MFAKIKWVRWLLFFPSQIDFWSNIRGLAWLYKSAFTDFISTIRSNRYFINKSKAREKHKTKSMITPNKNTYVLHTLLMMLLFNKQRIIIITTLCFFLNIILYYIESRQNATFRIGNNQRVASKCECAFLCCCCCFEM